MRRSDREITDLAAVQGIVSRCMVLHLGLLDGQQPYIVPMNFGALWEGSRLTLYAHSALEGRKIDLIRSNPNVFVTMDCDGALIPGGTVCQYGYQFSSLMGTGQAHLVTDIREKSEGLAVLMRHQTGKAFEIPAEQADRVAVIRINLHEWTAKACP